MRVKSALVLGGSGFLGSHVADALTQAGFEVRLFDLQPSPYQQPQQEMILGSILDGQAITSAAIGCDYIFNFAGLSDIDEARDQPMKTAELNVLGNVQALEAARIVNAKRYIFASSVYVYSELGSFYRASKQAAERFVEAYHERYQLPYTILRYGSLYGRRADHRNGIFRLLKQALENRTIVYHGCEETSREYIHVLDAARLSVQILDEAYANRHLILTGQERLSIKKLLKMVAEMIPGGIDIQYSTEGIYGHYSMTPYTFNPKIGNKLVSNDYVEMGQGLLDCLAELHEKSHGEDPWQHEKYAETIEMPA